MSFRRPSRITAVGQLAKTAGMAAVCLGLYECCAVRPGRVDSNVSGKKSQPRPVGSELARDAGAGAPGGGWQSCSAVFALREKGSRGRVAHGRRSARLLFSRSRQMVRGVTRRCLAIRLIVHPWARSPSTSLRRASAIRRRALVDRL